jgi:bifunctional polynucleotide phosphatase/kinase
MSENYWFDNKSVIFYYNAKFMHDYISEIFKKTKNATTSTDESDESSYDSSYYEDSLSGDIEDICPSVTEVFDLDGTIIETKSGKKFAEDSHDWKFLPGVLEKFTQIASNGDYFMVIISNQASIRSATIDKVPMFSKKLENVIGELAKVFNERNNKLYVFSVFSLYKDDIFYRKPYPGSWDIIKAYIPLKESLKEIVYVGDACGRPQDTSSVDIKFSRNTNMGFMTPEEFFRDDTKVYERTIEFEPRRYINTAAHLPNSRHQIPNIKAIFNNSNDIYLIVMMGYSGSGKSTFAKHIINEVSIDFELVSNKTCKTIEKAQKMMQEHLNHNYSVIVDYDNASRLDRTTWINFAKSIKPNIKVYLFEMMTSKDLSMHLNIIKARNKRLQINPVKEGVYDKYEAEYETIAEKIEEINNHYQIPFMPVFNNVEKLREFLMYT